MHNIKEALSSHCDRKLERVDTPEWENCPFVYVSTMSGKERIEFINANRDIQDTKTGKLDILTNARMAAQAIVDENGKRVFNDSDIDFLAGKRWEVLDRINTKWLEINGMGAAIEKDAKKNF